MERNHLYGGYRIRYQDDAKADVSVDKMDGFNLGE